MGIRRRILLSFFILFAFVLLAAAVISQLLITQWVHRRLGDQTQNVAELIRRQPITESYLEYLKVGYGAESIRIATPGGASGGERTFHARIDDTHEVVMTYGADLVSRERAAAPRFFALVAVAGGVLVLVLGYIMAHAIARPLETLSAQARSLPEGGVQPVGGGVELDHLVEAMNRMLAEVRRREQLAVMGQMAAGVAHEIRNPLSAMKMTVQMLRESAPDREPYDLLLREIERLELTASELVGASQPLRKERAKLDAVVGEILELMRYRLDHLGIKVERRLAPGLEVEIDVARFKRCIMNLILNGAQAMPAGGALTVETAVRGSRARFSVTDTGKGVPAAVRERVFEPFVTTKQDGVGLGLALTRRIVEDHGGTIGFGETGSGTTFWIDLPHG